MNTKDCLYNKCQEFIADRLHTIQYAISENQKALHSETKSSAGDKHETGRAMLQLEMEKAGQQLSGILQMKETIAKINPSKSSDIAHLGSIIFTSNVNYFIAISAGKIVVDSKEYFAVSPSSPVGKVLLGKRKGALISFNNMDIEIINVM
ncbi:MAG: 3-oxoacyl-ACP synthase [Flavobacteriaceae bacterium]|nr:3-oxoacyl-ACP synthase [Flavobacteriaceae bacterium]